MKFEAMCEVEKRKKLKFFLATLQRKALICSVSQRIWKFEDIFCSVIETFFFKRKEQLVEKFLVEWRHVQKVTKSINFRWSKRKLRKHFLSDDRSPKRFLFWLSCHKKKVTEDGFETWIFLYNDFFSRSKVWNRQEKFRTYVRKGICIRELEKTLL